MTHVFLRRAKTAHLRRLSSCRQSSLHIWQTPRSRSRRRRLSAVPPATMMYSASHLVPQNRNTAPWRVAYGATLSVKMGNLSPQEARKSKAGFSSMLLGCAMSLLRTCCGTVHEGTTAMHFRHSRWPLSVKTCLYWMGLARLQSRNEFYSDRAHSTNGNC